MHILGVIVTLQENTIFGFGTQFLVLVLLAPAIPCHFPALALGIYNSSMFLPLELGLPNQGKLKIESCYHYDGR
jgi:hypothetical protein